MKKANLIHDILAARGVKTKAAREAFLNPDYETSKHDPFLLPDMRVAVDRLIRARDNHEKVTIYGDYDIDGMVATVILAESLGKFGLDVTTYTPNRFTEGYGLNIEAIKTIGESDTDLIVTVDCGSLSHEEIAFARECGIDTIVTDHHAVAETLPPAIATINPKRADHEYPFRDLAGCGVAFKLVQALQTEMKGLPAGQEKWLLDLVALGTVCDVVALLDENRTYVKWGIEVMKKTRRPGLRALIEVAGIKKTTLNARALGFALGPRLNAAGRLETAELALELLQTNDNERALELAYRLDQINKDRRVEQDRIFAEAVEKVSERAADPVIVVSDPSWNEGVIGIVASKLMERFGRPAFVLAEVAEHSKGSGRSFGDFSMAEVIHATSGIVTRGGGHAAAGGLTLATERIDEWRQAVNSHYCGLKLTNQSLYLLPQENILQPNFDGLNLDLVEQIATLEPFGHGNETPVFAVDNVTIVNRRTMGQNNQHVRYIFVDQNGVKLTTIAFSMADEFTTEPGETVKVWVELALNEWQGRTNVEGRLLRME